MNNIFETKITKTKPNNNIITINLANLLSKTKNIFTIYRKNNYKIFNVKYFIFIVFIISFFCKNNNASNFQIYNNNTFNIYDVKVDASENNNNKEKDLKIGPFIINKTTTAIINKIKLQAKNLNYKSVIENITYRDDILSELKHYYNGGGIIEKNHYCPNLKIWEISKYYIGEIELSDITLFFYNDKLFKLTCNYNKDLVDGLIYKYGKINEKEWKEKFPTISCGEITTSKKRNIWENNIIKINAFTYHQYFSDFYHSDHYYSEDCEIKNPKGGSFIMEYKLFDYDKLKECDAFYKKEYFKKAKKIKYKDL